ncbi:hypothetical protein QCA50_020295 [Cerrena zonata]|uniref:Uncharacterized protein n=1 Tax=Cerrena zonata TaxID=2478898 RepID=A0AAW0FF26_9APHY
MQRDLCLLRAFSGFERGNAERTAFVNLAALRDRKFVRDASVSLERALVGSKLELSADSCNKARALVKRVDKHNGTKVYEEEIRPVDHKFIRVRMNSKSMRFEVSVGRMPTRSSYIDSR